MVFLLLLLLLPLLLLLLPQLLQRVCAPFPARPRGLGNRVQGTPVPPARAPSLFKISRVSLKFVTVVLGLPAVWTAATVL